METTTTKQQNSEVLASDILVAILVKLEKLSGKRQLFLKVNYNDLQSIMSAIFPLSNDEVRHLTNPLVCHLTNLSMFSNSGPKPFSPQLQEAIEQLQFSGMICWPDVQEPDLMRLNPSATNYYRKELIGSGDKKLSIQNFLISERIAKKINKFFLPFIIVDRPHLMNC